MPESSVEDYVKGGGGKDAPPSFDVGSPSVPMLSAGGSDPPLGKLEKEADSLKADSARISTQLAESSKQRMSLADQIAKLKPPEPPQLTPPEKPPGAPQQTSPLEAFGSVAGWLAVFGGLLTKHPLKTSLDASAAAMNAYRQKDLDAFDQNLKTWKVNSEYAGKLQQYQLDLYKTSMDSHKGNIDQLMTSWGMIAAANQDAVMQHTLKTGDFSLSEKLYSDRVRQAERFDDHRLKLAEFAEHAHHNMVMEQKAPPGSLERQLITQWAKEEFERTGQPPTAEALMARLEKHKQADKPPSAAMMREETKASEVAALLDLGEETVAKIKMTTGALGFAGKGFRPGETLANLLKVSDATTRRDIESAIVSMRTFGLRLMNDRSIMTKDDDAHSKTIIRGLEPGSTIENTISSMEAFNILLVKKYAGALKRHGFIGGDSTLPAGGGGVEAVGSAPTGGPEIGTEEDGYRFKGGDPTDKANWEKVK